MKYKMGRWDRGFTLVELLTVVLALGLLIAVSIPSYLRYVWRSRSAEAVMNLGLIAKGAKIYHLADHHEADGRVLQKQFPRSAPLPERDECGKEPGEKCGSGMNGRSLRFQADQAWIALTFDMLEPHYYVYHYTSVSAPLVVAGKAGSFLSSAMTCAHAVFGSSQAPTNSTFCQNIDEPQSGPAPASASSKDRDEAERARRTNRSGLADGTNPGAGSGRDNSPNQGTNNPNQAGR